MRNKRLAKLKLDVELYQKERNRKLEGFSIAVDGVDYRRILSITKSSIKLEERRKEKHSLGRWTLINLPFGLQLSYDKSRYARDLAGVPKDYSIDWIIDEFDESFNSVAAASLYYHLNLGVADNEHSREYFEKLSKELIESEKHTFELTDEEIKHQDKIFETWNTGKRSNLTCRCDICKNISKKIREAEKEKTRRVQKAREEFLEVLPCLWS